MARRSGVFTGLLLTLLAAGCTAPVREPCVWIAHRGASFDAPENTLAAVNLAWEKGAGAVEVDVHLTRDGRVVVIHDKDTKRTTGVPGAVRARTLAELERLDAGRFKGSSWTGERIPTLAEVLDTVPPGRKIFVEIKCGAGILPALERVFARSAVPPRDAVLIAFDRSVLAAAKRRLPAHPACWLCERKQDPGTGAWHPPVEVLVEQARAAGLDGLDVRASPGIDRAFADRVHAAGLVLYTWTVDDPAEARRLIEAGVDGITTDRPAWLRDRAAHARVPAGGPADAGG